MSGTTPGRLLPANITLLQPGSRAYRLADALTAPSSQLQVASAVTQNQITTLQNQITTLEGQITTLQTQVALLQAFQNGFNYLQLEVSTGTYFLDGRTIYKRSFVINNALNTGLTNFVYPHGIANINYIVSMLAMAGQAGGQQLPITFINMATAPSISIGISGWADTTNIIISVGTQTFVGYQILATLWYTATDR